MEPHWNLTYAELELQLRVEEEMVYEEAHLKHVHDSRKAYNLVGYLATLANDCTYDEEALELELRIEEEMEYEEDEAQFGHVLFDERYSECLADDYYADYADEGMYEEEEELREKEKARLEQEYCTKRLVMEAENAKKLMSRALQQRDSELIKIAYGMLDSATRELDDLEDYGVVTLLHCCYSLMRESLSLTV